MPSLFEMSSSTASALEIEEMAPNPTLVIEDFAEMLKNFDDKYDRAKENAFLSDLVFNDLDKIFWALKNAHDNLPASQEEAATANENVDEKMSRVCLQMLVLERKLKKAQVFDERITTSALETDEIESTEAGNDSNLEIPPFEAPNDEVKDAEEKLNGKIESIEASNDSILELSPFEAPTDEEKDAEEKLEANGKIESTEAGNESNLEFFPFEAPTDEEKDVEEILDANGKIESTEAGDDSKLELSTFEAPTVEEKDVEEKFDDMILKENDLNESKSAVTVGNFEIEQDVDPLIQETEDVDVTADPDKENVRVTPNVEETNKEKEPTSPTASTDSQDLGKKFRNLPKFVTEDDFLEVNASEAAVNDNFNDVSFNHAPLPFDPGINSKEESSNDEEVVDLSSSSKEEDSTDGSESQDVFTESLVFQPDAPSVVVCVRCHNTFPIIVLLITTRGLKHSRNTEHAAGDRSTSKHYDFTDVLSPEVKARDQKFDAIDQEGD